MYLHARTRAGDLVARRRGELAAGAPLLLHTRPREALEPGQGALNPVLLMTAEPIPNENRTNNF